MILHLVRELTIEVQKLAYLPKINDLPYFQSFMNRRRIHIICFLEEVEEIFHPKNLVGYGLIHGATLGFTPDMTHDATHEIFQIFVNNLSTGIGDHCLSCCRSENCSVLPCYWFDSYLN